MSTFKKGDRIEFTEFYNSAEPIYVGETGTVMVVGKTTHGEDPLVTVQMDNGKRTTAYSRRMRLADDLSEIQRLRNENIRLKARLDTLTTLVLSWKE